MNDLDSIKEQHSELTHKNLKETKSTLNGYYQSSRRRSGNTTRQIDLAIQYLFNGYIVKILDHYMDGSEIGASRRLLDVLIKRLNTEHPGIRYKLNTKNFEYTIELLNQNS